MKRITFTFLWTLGAFLVSPFIVGAASGILIYMLATIDVAAGLNITENETLANLVGLSWITLPLLFAATALILGMNRKLPGTN
jgi:hypothetical protein